VTFGIFKKITVGPHLGYPLGLEKSYLILMCILNRRYKDRKGKKMKNHISSPLETIYLAIITFIFPSFSFISFIECPLECSYFSLLEGPQD